VGKGFTPTLLEAHPGGILGSRDGSKLQQLVSDPSNKRSVAVMESHILVLYLTPTG
jgi:hypothetical protein